MRQDGARDPLRVAAPPQFLAAAKRVVGSGRKPLVVEIVQQANDTPVVFISSGEAGVTANRGFHRERMLPQAVARGPLRQQRPRLVTVQRHCLPAASASASLAAAGGDERACRGVSRASSSARVITAAALSAR